MVKEFYILKESNLWFYYTKNKKNVNLDDIILSSGLLSALDSFTVASRSDQIDSFNTEKEIFTFKSYATDPKFKFVFVFDTLNYNKVISNLIIDNIYNIIINSKILEVQGNIISIDTQRQNEIIKEIDIFLEIHLAEQINDEFLENLLSNHTDIEYCVIKEIPEGNVKARYSKRISLQTGRFEDELELIVSVVNKALNNLNLADNYLIISFQSEDQQFIIFNMGIYYISFLGTINQLDYFITILKNFMASSNLFQFAKYKIADFAIKSTYTSDPKGKIIFEEGVIYPKARIFLGTLVHNLRKFSDTILIKKLDNLSIIYLSKKKELSIIKASIKEDSMQITINSD